MPTVEEFKIKIKLLKEAVLFNLPEIAAGLTVSAKALAERNIKEKGFLENYSKNRIPTWFLEGKELNGAGTAFLAEKKKKDQQNTHVQNGVKFYPEDYGTNWGEFRQAQGLQIDHVDLSYSNKMWASMAPVRIEQRGNVVVAPLGSNNIEGQDKMNWNFQRYGDFIGKSLTDQDRELLAEYVLDEIGQIIEEYKF